MRTTVSKVIAFAKTFLARPTNVAMVAVVGAIALTLAVGGVAYVWGVIDGKYRTGAVATAERFEFKLFGNKFQRAAIESETSSWEDSTKRLQSTFFNLDVEVATVEGLRKGRGGGLTSLGDEIVLLTHDGGIFIATGPDDIAQTDVKTPDNGYDAYALAAVERLADFQHEVDYLRYNDILYFNNGADAGLVISYTEWVDAEDCYRTVLAQLPLAPGAESLGSVKASPGDWSRVYETEPCLPLKTESRAIEGHTAGGRIVFKAPSTVYLASGDYSWDGFYAPKAISQDPAYDYGKVIAVDLATGEGRQVSMGHRNTQGISFDGAGNLWTVEHGHRGGDELNHIEDGVDYGWPKQTLGTRYSGLPIPGVVNYGHHDIYPGPAYAWLPSIAISSLNLIENFDPIWNGDLLLASLASQNLYRIHLDGVRVQYVEEIAVGQRIRYALPHNDGRIVLWTDNQHLVFLSKGKADFTASFVEEFIEDFDGAPAVKARLATAIDACRQCHALNADEHRNAPALGQVAGSTFGSTTYAGYSEALRSAGGAWDEATLIAYIDDPQSVIAGTIMPDPGVDDPDVQRALAQLLLALKEEE